MLHHRGGYNAGPYCEGARGLIGSKTLDAQADARRSLRRGRFAKTTPETRSTYPLARDGCCPHREHAIQYVASDEGLWGTSVKERHATIGREDVSSSVKRDFRGERGVVEMIPPTRQGPCSGSAKQGSTPGVTAKTSRLLSAGASEKQVEYFEGGPGQARARALRRGGAVEVSWIPPVKVGVQNC